MPVAVVEATRSSAGEREPALPVSEGRYSALPALLVVAACVIGIVSAQGGYFPTSWGLPTALLLWSMALWSVVSGRTDVGRVDLLFLGLLAAFTGWVGLSIAWSEVPAESVLELERTFLLLAGVATLLALARREHVPKLFGAVLLSVALVSTYALATRLFPDRIGHYDPKADYRLLNPLGYWNTLGLFAAIGMLLAVGVVAEARSRTARAAAAASIVVLADTLYFTYSRGAWIALALGLAVLLLVTPRRLRALWAALILAGPAGLGILLATRSEALTHWGAPVRDVAADGHRLAPALLVLSAVAAALALLDSVAQPRVAVPRSLRMAFGAMFVAAVLVVVSALVVREGGPVALVRQSWRSFAAPPLAPGNNLDLDRRLFQLSGTGRVEIWRAAGHDYADHPLTGSGAGTFERFWQSQKNATFKVRDAHSLYIETLAELGPVGLALLIALLAVPLGAGIAVRRQPMLPAALAAYAAFVIHAGVDWDWELGGVTLTALFIGSLGIIALRSRPPSVIGGGVRVAACGVAVAASFFAIVVFLGNGALDRSQKDVTAKAYADAVREAERARRLMPWSPWPLIVRGDAELAAGDNGAAAASYRHAIRVDAGEWRAWLGVAFASHGASRRAALAHARRLYPRSKEIARAATILEDKTKG